jgi:hypothetical protein
MHRFAFLHNWALLKKKKKTVTPKHHQHTTMNDDFLSVFELEPNDFASSTQASQVPPLGDLAWEALRVELEQRNAELVRTQNTLAELREHVARLESAVRVGAGDWSPTPDDVAEVRKCAHLDHLNACSLVATLRQASVAALTQFTNTNALIRKFRDFVNNPHQRAMIVSTIGQMYYASAIKDKVPRLFAENNDNTSHDVGILLFHVGQIKVNVHCGGDVESVSVCDDQTKVTHLLNELRLILGERCVPTANGPVLATLFCTTTADVLKGSKLSVLVAECGTELLSIPIKNCKKRQDDGAELLDEALHRQSKFTKGTPLKRMQWWMQRVRSSS